MEPVLLHRTAIEEDLWNRCIQHARFSCIYAYSWYLDTVSPNWQALIIKEQEAYVAVMPLPLQKRWGLPLVAQPFYCHYLGIFSSEQLSPSLVEIFLRILSKQFVYISSYRFHPSLTPVLEKSSFFKQHFQAQVVYTELLPLSPARLPSSHYTKDRKKNLLKAQKFGWKLDTSTDIQPLITLFEEHHAPQIAGGIHPKSGEWLTYLYQQLSRLGNATLWYAQKEGKIHAGTLVVHHQQQHYYLFNAADPVGRRYNARTWLLDLYLTSISSTVSEFDFESPTSPSIRSFYQSFGAISIPFYQIRLNRLPFPLRWIQEYRVKKAQ